MFDFSRITDAISTMAGIGPGQPPDEPGGLTDPGDLGGLLEQVGLDPSALTGMSGPEVLELLQAQGIDVSQIAGGELDQLLAGLGGGDTIAGLVSSYFDNSGDAHR